MRQIALITRFIAYLPDPNGNGRREREQAASQVEDMALTPRQREPWLLATESTTKPDDEPSSMLLDVFPGTAVSARLAARSLGNAVSMEELHRQAEASSQCYNLLCTTPEKFVFESDMLGLKTTYVARTPGGRVMASRIDDILRLFPELAEPADTTALYELLGFWAPLRGRTLHQPIRRTLPGGRYRWTHEGEWVVDAPRKVQPIPIDSGRLLDEAISDIRDMSRVSLREKTVGATDPILLALSGGFDSRFIAGLCRDLDLSVRAIGYGRRHHQESVSARATAKALNLDLTMIRQDRNATLRYLPNHLDATEGTADCGSVSSMNLLATPTAIGSTLLHGFLGDVLAGYRVNDFTARDYASHMSLADAIIRRNYPSSRPDLFGLFHPAPDPEEVRQDVLDGLNRDCAPYLAYVLWFLENRTRRYVASHFSVLGQHFDVVMPFYDRRLCALWFSLPPAALADRHVFRKLLARYYPALARIPHAEEAAPIIPNLRWQLARLYHTLPRRALTRCIGDDRTKRLLLRTYRASDFRSFSKLSAPQQRARMLSTLATSRPALRDVLGIDLSPGYEAMLSDDLQALRSMFTVACYAQRRCESRGLTTALADAPQNAATTATAA